MDSTSSFENALAAGRAIGPFLAANAIDAAAACDVGVDLDGTRTPDQVALLMSAHQGGLPN